MGIAIISNTGNIRDTNSMAIPAPMQVIIIFKASLGLFMANRSRADLVKQLQEIEIVHAKEKVDMGPFLGVFAHRVITKDRDYTRHTLPRVKHWLFVKYLFQGMQKRQAYLKAGYKKPKTRFDQHVRILMNSKSVQRLINIVISDYARKRELSAQKLLDQAIELYDRCDTVREQLDVLKFINDLLPKGHANHCNLIECPLRKRKQ
jgi:hypothetical protein